jgi:hypothetical protein
MGRVPRAYDQNVCWQIFSANFAQIIYESLDRLASG